MDKEKMLDLAKQVAKNAWTKYTDYIVGAVLLTNNGKTYTGCNIQNLGIQAICAERVAFVKAISEGERDFKSILIIGKKGEDKFFKETLPCGYCRQFMSEFCKPDFKIYTCDEEKDEYKEYTLKELLPYGFSL